MEVDFKSAKTEESSTEQICKENKLNPDSPYRTPIGHWKDVCSSSSSSSTEKSNDAYNSANESKNSDRIRSCPSVPSDDDTIPDSALKNAEVMACHLYYTCNEKHQDFSEEDSSVATAIILKGLNVKERLLLLEPCAIAILLQEQQYDRWFSGRPFPVQNVVYNEKTIQILFDWMMAVTVKFKLLWQTFVNACYIAMNFLNNSETKDLNRNLLQLVGTTCLIISAKLEEVYIPEIVDYVYICDKAYNAKQFIEMERKILWHLNFDVQSVNHLFLAVALSEIFFDTCNRQKHLQIYIATCICVDFRLIAKYEPIYLALAVILIARCTLGYDFLHSLTEWQDICSFCKAETDKLKSVASDVCACQQFNENRFRACYCWFIQSKCLSVATMEWKIE